MKKISNQIKESILSSNGAGLGPHCQKEFEKYLDKNNYGIDFHLSGNHLVLGHCDVYGGMILDLSELPKSILFDFSEYNDSLTIYGDDSNPLVIGKKLNWKWKGSKITRLVLNSCIIEDCDFLNQSNVSFLELKDCYIKDWSQFRKVNVDSLEYNENTLLANIWDDIKHIKKINISGGYNGDMFGRKRLDTITK